MAEEEDTSSSSSSESFDSDISISEEVQLSIQSHSQSPLPSSPLSLSSSTSPAALPTTDKTNSPATSPSTTSPPTSPPTSPSTTSPPVGPYLSGEQSKQGFIELKDYTKKSKLMDKWKLNWCLLVGSSLFIYKNYEKTTPYLILDLRTLTLGEAKHHNRQFSFSLQTISTSSTASTSTSTSTPSSSSPSPPPSPSPSPSLSPSLSPSSACHKWVAFCTALELTQWRAAFLGAKDKAPVPVPVSKPIPSDQRTTTSLYKIKKSVAGRAATSKMGEVLLMKMFGDEIHHLFHTVKKIIAKHHSKEVAARVHKVLIRLTIKIAFLFEKRVLSITSLAEVDRPLREAMELLSKFYNAKVRRFPKAFPVVETFARIEKLSLQAESCLERQIQPYISPKNLANIHFLFETVANGPFLQKVFSDTDLADELDELDDVITAYTQFHI